VEKYSNKIYYYIRNRIKWAADKKITQLLANVSAYRAIFCRCDAKSNNVIRVGLPSRRTEQSFVVATCFKGGTPCGALVVSAYRAIFCRCDLRWIGQVCPRSHVSAYRAIFCRCDPPRHLTRSLPTARLGVPSNLLSLRHSITNFICSERFSLGVPSNLLSLRLPDKDNARCPYPSCLGVPSNLLSLRRRLFFGEGEFFPGLGVPSNLLSLRHQVVPQQLLQLIQVSAYRAIFCRCDIAQKISSDFKWLYRRLRAVCVWL
jgi:hypothetical protein